MRTKLDEAQFEVAPDTHRINDVLFQFEFFRGIALLLNEEIGLKVPTDTSLKELPKGLQLIRAVEKPAKNATCSCV